MQTSKRLTDVEICWPEHCTARATSIDLQTLLPDSDLGKSVFGALPLDAPIPGFPRPGFATIFRRRDHFLNILLTEFTQIDKTAFMNTPPIKSRRNQTVSVNLEKSLSRYALATASLAAVAIPAVAQADFSGPYDVSNWTFQNTGSALLPPAGFVDTSGAPASITLTGGNGGVAAGPSGTTDFTITAVASGLVSFDWNYSSTDSLSYDTGNFILNGTPTVLATNATQGNGNFSIAVNTNDVFGFQVFTADAAAGPGVLGISNFSAPIPESSTMALFALGSVGVLVLMRRRARNAT